MTKQLTPLRRKDQATGYQAAVRDIVAWLQDWGCSDCGDVGRRIADQIKDEFGGHAE